ncbi:GNAT family N-acetyltransferase [Nitrosospira sp. Nsp2]|uniref:GNAT family N-acetyltransferase n=1 Tax=Nitrosospira sp. Nsp2 TaxID=136548 RepID=UPI000D3211DF|nr:GNAT family N-acetyltransferase [Nitrosospira sp. Nsp2]
MNTQLIALLKANMGVPLTWDLAADIYVAAGRIETLVNPSNIEQIRPVIYEDTVFARERMEDIVHEMKLLHQAHWNETEAHRHGLALNPDYDMFYRYERAGRYVLFTLRNDGRLQGNCALYLDKSTHTQTLIATEDTLYLLPEARKRGAARQFVEYCENALKSLGVKEINVSVKTVNKAGRFFRMLGYRHVENGLSKILED